MNTQDQPLDLLKVLAFLGFLMLNIVHAIYGHSCSTNLFFFFFFFVLLYLYELGLQKVVRYNFVVIALGQSFILKPK